MEVYTLSWIWFLVSCALIQGIYSLELTTNDIQGNLDGEVTIVCSYTLGDGETFSMASISYAGSEIVRFTQGIAGWGSGATDDFKSRANFSTSENANGGTFFVLIQKTVCADIKSYKCSLTGYLQSSGSFLQEKEATLSLTLEAYPEKPSLEYTPTSLTDPTEVTFTCSGVIGLPQSSIKWKQYRAISDSWSDITTNIEDTVITNVAAPNDCVFHGSSVMRLKLTKFDNMNKVRCVALNGALDQGNTEYYNETEALSVEYRVDAISVSTTPNANNEQSFEEGTSKVSLSCSADGNPLPQYTWTYSKSSDSTEVELGSGKDYSLENLKISDTGDYKCSATNTVDGVAYNVSRVLNINIVPTTTPKPTTTPISTTGDTHGITGGWTEKDDDSQTIIIIVVVCVVVVVIGLIILLVCCIKKKRNEKKQSHIEEPPMKPRNNQDLNFKNKQDYYGKPDLVTTDSLKKPYNKDYNVNDDALNYADMKFDDKPRSRRPVQINTDYSEIAMPRV